MRPIDRWDRPIGFNRAFVTLGVGINGALMLTQIVYWAKRTKDVDGWFYKTGEEWEDETGLTRTEQEGARRRLRDLGVIEEDRRGVPCRTFFRLKIDVLDALLNGGQAELQFAGNPQTGLRETRKLVCRKPASLPAGNPQTITGTTRKETTAGTTSESGAHARAPGALASFAMRLDWKPDQNYLETYAKHQGVQLTEFNPDLIAEFTAHWSADGSFKTEAQWVQKLVQRAKTTRGSQRQPRIAAARQRPATAQQTNFRAGLNADGSMPA